MGLDISHGAFGGAYSSFNRFRQAVAWAAGCIFPHYDLSNPREVERLKELDAYPPQDKLGDSYWYAPDGFNTARPALHKFLCHSDCDGQIPPQECADLANELELLLPKIEDNPYPAAGHILRDGGYTKVLERFIGGCRLAASRGEPLDFH